MITVEVGVIIRKQAVDKSYLLQPTPSWIKMSLLVCVWETHRFKAYLIFCF